MTIYTDWSAGDACELSMRRFYCMDFAATDGDPERFREICEREGKDELSVTLFGPEIEDLRKRVSFDGRWLNVSEVFKMVPLTSRFSKEQLKFTIGNVIQRNLNRALWHASHQGPKNKRFRGCFFVQKGDSFRLRHMNFSSFYNCRGFTKGSEEILVKVAQTVAKVATKLEQENESGVFLQGIRKKP